MILTIDYKSGEREFHLEGSHMDPAPDTIAPLLAHLVDLMVSLHPEDVFRVIPMHVPELAGAEAARHAGHLVDRSKDSRP